MNLVREGRPTIAWYVLPKSATTKFTNYAKVVWCSKQAMLSGREELNFGPVGHPRIGLCMVSAMLGLA